MDFRQYVRQQLPTITADAARDGEIVEELAQHLACRYDELLASGMPGDEALAVVAGELRDRARLARAIRQADRARALAPTPPATSSGRLTADLWSDLRYAIRLLRRSPGFTAAALLTLALGVGITTAIFSVTEAVLLRPVPLPDFDRLVMMWETDRHSSTVREPASIPDFIDYRDRTRQVDRVGAFSAIDVDVTPPGGDPRRVSALAATPDLLQLLGASIVAGRLFTAEEDRPGGPPLALISDRVWEELFSRSHAAIGQAIRVNETQRTIVGVLSPTADFGVLQILSAAAYARGFADRDARARVDVWLPLQADASRSPRGGNHGYLMIGHLAPGATVASAHDEMVALAADLERTYPQDNAGRGAFVEALDDVVLGRTRRAMNVLMAAATLVLLVACVNVANLLLARGTVRAREVAVRTALGAATPRLARQFMVENLVLTVTAAALAIPLAYAALRLLVAVGPPDIPRLTSVSVDTRVLLLALAVSLVIGVVFGMVPVFQARWTEVQTALRGEGGNRLTTGPRGRRVRSALVVAEVAFAVVLVTGAGLLMRSFWNLSQTDPGFTVTNVIKAEFRASPRKYPGGPTPGGSFAAFNRLTADLIERTGRLPGVEAVALAANHPLDTGFTQSFRVVGREAEGENWPELSLRHVTAGYFDTLRVPLLRGRLFSEADTSSSEGVVIVNQATADRFFANRDAVGQVIRFWGLTWTVVGVVGNERFQGIANAAPIGAYVPLAQTRLNQLALIARTTGDPRAFGPSVAAAIREIDPELAVFGVEPLSDTLAQSLSQPRFMMLLLGLFGALALVLAAIGVHGVLTYLVAQRTHEIGVRMALGAPLSRVTALIVGEGLRPVAIGLLVGLALSLALGQSMSGLLHGVAVTDVPTLAGVTIVLGAAAAAAVWFPARRALHVDPLIALREE